MKRSAVDMGSLTVVCVNLALVEDLHWFKWHNAKSKRREKEIPKHINTTLIFFHGLRPLCSISCMVATSALSTSLFSPDWVLVTNSEHKRQCF
jgi:hypothetical protein